MTALASLNMKLPLEDKIAFTQIAETLGLPSSIALKVLVKRFIEAGGFPFDVRLKPRSIDWNDPNLIHTYTDKNGNLIMPTSWRDGDNDDDEDGLYE